MRFDSQDGIDRGVQRRDWFEKGRIFALLIEVKPSQVCEDNPLSLGTVCAPFKTRLLKILHDQIFLKLERRDRVAKLWYTAMGFEKIEKRQTDRVASRKRIATRRVFEFELVRWLEQSLPNGGHLHPLIFRQPCS